MTGDPDLDGRILSAALNVVGTLLGAGLGALLHSAWSRFRDRHGGTREVLRRLDAIDARLDKAESDAGAMREAQHVAMRQQLSHNAEKYLRRGWLTAEERQSWWEMYVAYGTMGQNGYMGSYWQRLEDLPIRALDEMIGKGE